MIGIFKANEIATLGGTVPQVSGVTVVGQINDWTVVSVEDYAISSIQEFNIQPVSESFLDALNGPKAEGAYNAPAMQVTSYGDKMRIEMNPGQVIIGVEGIEDGTILESPDLKDDQSKRNFTSEDIAGYKTLTQFIKKYDAKSVLRNQIRGTIVDIEDDIADTKVAIQSALYYFAHEWNGRSEAQKASNPSRTEMDLLVTKLLSDDTKMRADLANGIDNLNEILEKEEKINKFIVENYTYNSERGK